MKRSMLIIFLVFTAIFISSCSIYIPGRPSFIDTSFNYSAMASRGVVVLPVTGEKANVSIRKETGGAFTEELKKRCPDIEITDPQSSGSKLVKANLIDRYNEAVSIYNTVGSWESNKLIAIAESFNSRYLIILFISGYDREMKYDKQNREMGYGYTLRLEVFVWDVEIKETVFENIATGDAEPSGWLFGLFSEDPYDAAAEAGRHAARYFPRGS